jgi:hypothetical protein
VESALSSASTSAICRIKLQIVYVLNIPRRLCGFSGFADAELPPLGFDLAALGSRFTVESGSPGDSVCCGIRLAGGFGLLWNSIRRGIRFAREFGFPWNLVRLGIGFSRESDTHARQGYS